MHPKPILSLPLAFWILELEQLKGFIQVLPTRKPTWQWKNNHLKTYLLEKNMGDFPSGHLCFTEGIRVKKFRQTIRNHILELPRMRVTTRNIPFLGGNPNKKTFICDVSSWVGWGGRPKSYLLSIKFRQVLGDVKKKESPPPTLHFPPTCHQFWAASSAGRAVLRRGTWGICFEHKWLNLQKWFDSFSWR